MTLLTLLATFTKNARAIYRSARVPENDKLVGCSTSWNYYLFIFWHGISQHVSSPILLVSFFQIFYSCSLKSYRITSGLLDAFPSGLFLSSAMRELIFKLIFLVFLFANVWPSCSWRIIRVLIYHRVSSFTKRIKVRIFMKSSDEIRTEQRSTDREKRKKLPKCIRRLNFYLTKFYKFHHLPFNRRRNKSQLTNEKKKKLLKYI